jgi:hypothetical protein
MELSQALAGQLNCHLIQAPDVKEALSLVLKHGFPRPDSGWRIDEEEPP